MPFLKKGGFIGQIDVNTIVSGEDGSPYALEFTPRPGYDATPTLTLGLPGYGEAVARALKIPSGGGNVPSDQRSLVEGADRPWLYLTAIRTYLPPYPFESTDEKLNREVYKATAGVEIQGWTPEQRRVLLVDAAQVDGKIVTAGTYSVPLIALGHGASIDEAVADNFKHLGEVKVANLCHRTDLGRRAKKAWPIIEPLLR